MKTTIDEARGHATVRTNRLISVQQAYDIFSRFNNGQMPTLVEMARLTETIEDLSHIVEDFMEATENE